MRNSNTYKINLTPMEGLQFRITHSKYPSRIVTVGGGGLWIEGTNLKAICPHNLGVLINGIGSGRNYSTLRPTHLKCISVPYAGQTMAELAKNLKTEIKAVKAVEKSEVATKVTSSTKRTLPHYEALKSDQDKQIIKDIYYFIYHNPNHEAEVNSTMDYIKNKYPDRTREDRNFLLSILYKDKAITRVANKYCAVTK